MTESTPAATAPHPLKLEIEQRGFVMSRIALRAGMTYGSLVKRLGGIVAMSADDEQRIRQAMEPDDSAELDPSHPLPPAA